MDNLFLDMLDKVVVVFMDDILMYSTVVEKHSELLEKVVTHLYKYAFYCKLKKCSFLPKNTTFFGFDISPKSIHISDTKVRSLKKWLKPATIQ